MKNILGWIAVIGIGILVFNGYKEAKKNIVKVIDVKK